MIEEKQVTLRKQTATEGSWLYQDDVQGNRVFAKSAMLGVHADPWLECSDADKQAWEEAHKPTEPEVQEAEVVDEQ